ncbi:hypothetical protein BJ980_003310 [Nocardioides daedukensis]|uniref:Uncharacterized protein n=1 Tax=Nocardioides daedukensis TaxID=634462 RepID=A0A7Y9URJ0_9ACTN|nr:hypothetical protein [Nocardioides daedukensis]NYG60387.1 hypothetical protein [Nocardioides daedukensis]
MNATLTTTLRGLVAALTCLLVLGACSPLDQFGKGEATKATTEETAAPEQEKFVSQFTRDGTYQSHVDVDGVDFVYTIWPTKSTPRTNEWYPRGSKFFSFTFTAYDLHRELRDKFKTKRKVYLGNIRVTSTTATTSGAVETPYLLDEEASRITFDPEPVKSRMGMLVTAPKGAFELRNQQIGELAKDTIGLTLVFEASVRIQRSAGSKRYDTEVIRQEVPIAIFASDTPTVASEIPINAN